MQITEQTTEQKTDETEAPHPGKFYRYRGIFMVLLAVLTLWLNMTFLVPVTMGAIFAVCLYPMMPRLSRWSRGRWTGETSRSLTITTVFSISFLLPVGLMLYYSAVAVLTKIQELQSDGIGQQQLNANAVIDFLKLRPFIDFLESTAGLSQAQINKGLINALTTVGSFGAGIMQNTMSSVPGALFGAFIIVLTIFFLLIDGPKAVNFLKCNSIFGPRETDRLFEMIASLCNSTVVASIAAGAVQALLILVSCLLTGTPNAILITLVAFILSFLPMLGTAPVTIFLTAQAFLFGNPGHGLLFAANVFIVGLSDNVVRPYVLKGGASLHPLVGFVAAFGALDMIGFYGVFIGPVVAGLFFEMIPMVAQSYGRRAKAAELG